MLKTRGLTAMLHLVVDSRHIAFDRLPGINSVRHNKGGAVPSPLRRASDKADTEMDGTWNDDNGVAMTRPRTTVALGILRHMIVPRLSSA